ncbi:HD family hydrolase [Desulfopila sp. IMCC35008]|uniref:HD domain-containing protein n=1 Tax=Desulfopila sp. IMCC35008 TaxID=2653858 RepID=UPI0013D3ECB4|nr:HD domain-containing protein [Desulfopila sp. IMCC35008]
MSDDNLSKQIGFLVEIDKLKTVFRRTYVLGTDRHENDAEHSWHLALMALVLCEYANKEVDVSHVLKMVLLHDIVEIYAGDTFCYDIEGNEGKAEREKQAAQKLYSLLPAVQKNDFIVIWEEFEKGETTESRFAQSLDRLMPLLHNYYSEGRAWREHGITRQQVLQRNAHIADGSWELWKFAQELINDSVEKGYLLP